VANSNNVSMEISCPDCGEIIDMTFELETEETENMQQLDELLAAVVGPVSHYTFRGLHMCECGKFVVGCIAVTAHDAIGRARLAALNNMD
jgi:hypothetical protein